MNKIKQTAQRLYDCKKYNACSEYLYKNFWQGKFIVCGLWVLSFCLSGLSLYLSHIANNTNDPTIAVVIATAAIAAAAVATIAGGVIAVDVVVRVVVAAAVGGNRIYSWITLKTINKNQEHLGDKK